MSEKKLFEGDPFEPDFGAEAGDNYGTRANQLAAKGRTSHHVNPDSLNATGEKMIDEPKSAPVKIEKPADPTPAAPAPKAHTPAPKAPEPKGDPSGGLPAIPWKQIAIVAGAAGLLAALIALLRKCTKSIKLRFNKSVRTLARMQKDFTLSKGGLDMRAVLPGVGSRLNDFLTRAFSGSVFMNNGRTGVMNNNKSARKFKDGVIGLYPFCDIYKEELRNDLTMAQTTFNKIKLAADTAGKDATTESYGGTSYQSFYEAFAADRLNEGENPGQVNESIMTLAALAPMVIRGGAFIVNKIKDGKAKPEDAKTVQVTKQSTREICYAILNNFFEKYISFEDVSKKMGVDIKGLSDVDESSIDKLGKVIKAYSNPDGGSVVKQYARVKTAYDKMLGHYLNIGNGIIKNFEKYTKADDEKHENLLVASKEKLSAMWEQQKDQYEHLFPYVMMEIVNDGAYAAYIDFITESVLPVFKTGIAGDADYVLDVMPKKGDYFLLSQTAQNGNIGNKAVCKVTKEYDKATKTIEIKLIALYKGNFTITPEGNYEIDTDPDNFDRKAYGAVAPRELDYNKFMSLDPHMITNMDEVIKKDLRFDLESYIDKDIVVIDKGLEPFTTELSNNYGISDVTALVYKITKVEGDKFTYIIEYVSNDKNIKDKLRFDENTNTYKANAEDFTEVPEDKRKEGTMGTELIDENHKPVTFTGDIKNLDANTKITFSVEQGNLKVQYEGFIERKGDKQEMHLKGTLNVEGEDKEKNDEKGRQSTVSKIMVLRIDKDMEGQALIDYMTEKYGAKFEKQENTEFSDAIKNDEKTTDNMSQTQTRDIGEQDDVYTNISDLTDEIIDRYRQQPNKTDKGATDINPFLMNYWVYPNFNGAIVRMVPTMEDPSNKDDNPTLNGIIVKLESAKNNFEIFGKININEKADKVAEQLKTIGASAKKIDGPDTEIAAIRNIKPENIKATADMPASEDEFKKFLEGLFNAGTGKNRDANSIKTYLTNLLVSLGENIELDYDKNAKPQQSQNNPNSGGQQGDQSVKKTYSTGDTVELDVDSSKKESINEDNRITGHDDPAQIKKDLENKNIKPNVKQDPSGQENEYDGSKAEANGNKITVTCGKLLYSDAEGNQQQVKFEIEFGLSPLWKPGEYEPTAVITNIYNKKSCSFPWENLNYAYVAKILLDSFEKMDVYLGEIKKEESLNDGIKESIKFTATYSINDKIIESAAFNTGITRKIAADKDCSKYYVLSECMWSMANDDAVKKALTNKVKSALKTYNTKEGLMEYAKANQNVEMSRNFSDMSYVVKNPGNLHSIIGCSLYECAVAVKFNDSNRISNAIAIGVNKIK